jgi:hypothetical protein
LHTVQLTEAGTCTVLPTSITLSGGGGTGGSAAFIAGTVGTAHKAVSKIWVSDVGQGYTSAPTINFNGESCTVNPVATVFIAGQGNALNSAMCFNDNIMPTQAWNGVLAMNPYPTTQLDSHNNCLRPGGGHNNTNPNGTPFNTCNGSAGAGPCTWQDVAFNNIVFDGSGAELRGTTGDLHLQTSSLGFAAGDDGKDIGANVDLVLGCIGRNGCTAGTPSQYTGITISGGVAIIPQ